MNESLNNFGGRGVLVNSPVSFAGEQGSIPCPASIVTLCNLYANFRLVSIASIGAGEPMEQTNKKKVTERTLTLVKCTRALRPPRLRVLPLLQPFWL